MVSSTPRPHFTPRKDPVPILHKAAWVPGPVWTGGKTLPTGDSIPDRPARSQSLYRLSYRARTDMSIDLKIYMLTFYFNLFCWNLISVGCKCVRILSTYEVLALFGNLDYFILKLMLLTKDGKSRKNT